MALFGRERVRPRTPDQLRAMRVAGLLVARTLEMLLAEARAGVTTAHLDALAEDFIRSGGGVPNFQLVPGYSHTLCTSVGDEIVHGIPGERVLREGDLLSIDCGAEVEGWNGDSAITLVVGGDAAGDPAAARLSEVTRRSMWAGIAAFRPGGDLNDIGGGVEDSIRADARADGVDYGIVEDYTGHGIGEHMHLPPNVPNYRVRGRTPQTLSGPPWPSSRWSPWAIRPTTSSTTSGPSSPTTASRRPTGSTRSRSPSAACGCSPPSTAARPS
ncbi:type I methionyl aminopeptidase [Janibacter hoylei]|uniref:type I methionyl aminopeptidase n=2 Tax=Janibacter hoylei TaxID=364298 RepID=UPI002AA2B0EC|nr:M24 family metallopeptidase [Janibacter hoylei]